MDLGNGASEVADEGAGGQSDGEEVGEQGACGGEDSLFTPPVACSTLSESGW